VDRRVQLAQSNHAPSEARRRDDFYVADPLQQPVQKMLRIRGSELHDRERAVGALPGGSAGSILQQGAESARRHSHLYELRRA
jgi:hypothetical protein